MILTESILHTNKERKGQRAGHIPSSSQRDGKMKRGMRRKVEEEEEEVEKQSGDTAIPLERRLKNQSGILGCQETGMEGTWRK
ncbi:hypothetical protein CgunFtcFv8_021527 [Champsocephalus gunnari]|uniref:Uncharacterized protein n=1 Tax=Champsocephalus gunnari TaxID=52237 RepID=A0AAN8HS81_CHAGU|nr:hypothetical protein CgunFtcFv8_021527 [Champsocephalus gunnari]